MIAEGTTKLASVPSGGSGGAAAGGAAPAAGGAAAAEEKPAEKEEEKEVCQSLMKLSSKVIEPLLTTYRSLTRTWASVSLIRESIYRMCKCQGLDPTSSLGEGQGTWK